MALQLVFKLNHELIVVVEQLETTNPILKIQECLFMRIEFSEYLLHELACHIETTQSLMFADE